ncbi:MAG: thioredoxin TrxC [Sphingomonas sp.]|jgi:thioredoxin 2|uniref:thioredoxin TrxC n=1 Tax=Sphingomonas sp. TaxID=28214 RepID=UPI003564E5AF
MTEAHIVCANCRAVNRLPEARLADGPKCGRCGKPLLTGAPVAADTALFDRLVMSGSQPVLVDFWASWCGPCKIMAPAFAAAAAELEPLVRLAKVDTEQAPDLAARYAIRSIPTLILFAGGKEVARRSGALDRATIIGWTRSMLGQRPQ